MFFPIIIGIVLHLGLNLGCTAKASQQPSPTELVNRPPPAPAAPSKTLVHLRPLSGERDGRRGGPGAVAGLGAGGSCGWWRHRPP
jgi:hypothetical protein